MWFWWSRSANGRTLKFSNYFCEILSFIIVKILIEKKMVSHSNWFWVTRFAGSSNTRALLPLCVKTIWIVVLIVCLCHHCNGDIDGLWFHKWSEMELNKNVNCIRIINNNLPLVIEERIWFIRADFRERRYLQGSSEECGSGAVEMLVENEWEIAVRASIWLLQVATN